MNASQSVGAPNVNPWAFKPLLGARDASVSAGTWRNDAHVFWRGAPATERQSQTSKLACSRCTARTARALATAASIFARFRTMPASPRSCRIRRPEAGDARGLEAVEGPAVRLTFLEDRRPAEPRLRGLEDEELEEAPVVVDRHPPLLVVVAEHRRVAVRPRAPSPHADLADRSVAARALQIREAVSRRRTWRRGRGRRRRGSARLS